MLCVIASHNLPYSLCHTLPSSTFPQPTNLLSHLLYRSVSLFRSRARLFSLQFSVSLDLSLAHAHTTHIGVGKALGRTTTRHTPKTTLCVIYLLSLIGNAPLCVIALVSFVALCPRIHHSCHKEIEEGVTPVLAGVFEGGSARVGHARWQAVADDHATCSPFSFCMVAIN